MARNRRSIPSTDPVSIPTPMRAPEVFGAPPTTEEFSTGSVPETTGRYLIVYSDEVMDSPKEASGALHRFAGIKTLASAADYNDEVVDPNEAGSLYFPALGVAVVEADAAQVQSLSSATADARSHILAIEPEYVSRALDDRSAWLEYLRGYRDAVSQLYEQLAGDPSLEVEIPGDAAFQDTPQFTWGLQATRVNTSGFTGEGVRVAILDTGMDLGHPDFQNRRITSQSFIPHQTAQDAQGHGTHCTGSACGPQRPATGVRRYGCATGADIFIGKVLNSSGSSVGSSVLHGMNWAVTNQCHVISMSLGTPVNHVSQAFEQAGRRGQQCEPDNRPFWVCGAASQQYVDHGGWDDRSPPAGGELLGSQQHGRGRWRQGGYRCARRGCVLELACLPQSASPSSLDQRNEHGDAPHCGNRCTVVPGQRPHRDGVLGDHTPTRPQHRWRYP